MSSPLQKLVESFHLFLDESLIVAIANDHNIEKASEYEAAYSILQGLAQSVPSEEATGFNPSGIYECTEEKEVGIKEDAPASASTRSEHVSQANKTDTSSTSQTSSNESGNKAPRLDMFSSSSEESKFHQLQGLFPKLKEYDIRYSLRKAKGDFQTALDDLLNVQYLQSTGQQAKGIDAFFHTEEQPTETKTRKRGKASVDHGLKERNRVNSSFANEFKNQSEIAYIAERFNISFDEVSALYYGTDCSNTTTVIEVLDQHLSHGDSKPLDDAQKKILEGLGRKYRNVPEKYAQAIIQTTGTVPRFSDDIAALANKHFKRPRSQRFDLSYSLAPLPIEDIEPVQTSINSKRSSRDSGNWISPPTSPKGIRDHAQALQLSEGFSQARRDAAASAASLHRRGASNPLYRQAASYYAEKAREHANYAQEATSVAADLLVEDQSTDDNIDLHGVSVYDGVRIARQKALSWWESRGKIRGEKKQICTLTIITGIGRHSAGGVSQLRKSVAAALLQDGWKMRVETGKFVIIGRQ
ncbi:Smr domain-containing protein [Cladobotryum mycophilum]|uniref:Smr domain-containing protein n=1 Tax=Cladobotryum mycophilum TaxID=491253 RepID=A0ABR0S7W6_9HYPO